MIRGEQNPVRIGHFSSIGDGTVIFTNHSLPAGIAASVNIGKNVTIESNCSIHSSIIDDDVVVGHDSVIMEGSRIERGAVILPNSVVPPGRLIPAGQVWGGNPIAYVRDLTSEELLNNYAQSYTNIGTEFEAGSLFPHKYQEGDLKNGEMGIEEYADKKYFRNVV